VLCRRIYRLDRIALPPARVNDRGMPDSPVSHTTKRPPEHELYDRGCELVEAAIAIRRLADDPGAVRAVPALLGCVEAAMHELGCAALSLDETSRDEVPMGAMADRLHRGFMTLDWRLRMPSSRPPPLAGWPRVRSPLPRLRRPEDSHSASGETLPNCRSSLPSMAV
jgi:hypothetical protein